MMNFINKFHTITYIQKLFQSDFKQSMQVLAKFKIVSYFVLFLVYYFTFFGAVWKGQPKMRTYRTYRTYRTRGPRGSEGFHGG